MAPTTGREDRAARRALAKKKKQTRLTFDPIAVDEEGGGGSAAGSEDGGGSVALDTARSHFSPAKVRYTRSPAARAASGVGSGLKARGVAREERAQSSSTSARARRNGKLPFKTLASTSRKSESVAGRVDRIDKGGEEEDSDSSSLDDLDPLQASYDKGSSARRSPMARRSTSRLSASLDCKNAMSSSPLRSSKPFTQSSQYGSHGSRKHRGRRGAYEDYEFSDDEESEEEEGIDRKQRGKVKPLQHPICTPPSEPQAGVALVKTEVVEEDEDSDPVLSSPLKRRHGPLVKAHLAAKDAEGVEDIDADSDDVVGSPPKRRRGADRTTVSKVASIAPTPITLDDSDSEPMQISVLRSSRNTHIKAPRSHPRTDAAPLDDEDDEPPASASRRTRQKRASRKPRTEREKKLELLRRRRAGDKRDLTPTDEESIDEGQNALYDSNSDLEVLGTFDDEDEEPATVVPPTEAATKKTSPLKSGYADSDLEDFVVEDDEAALGVPTPGIHDIPLQFTHAGRKTLKEHFKDAIEWFIHNKVNPAFNRDDEVYNVAFHRIERKTEGLASKHVSTQWTADFTRVLYARPIYVESKLAPGEGFMLLQEDKCEPCNHRKHPATWRLSFHGKVYHRTTLKEVDQESSDEDDDAHEDEDTTDESENGEPQEPHKTRNKSGKSRRCSVNSKGMEVVPETREWLSGKFCREKAGHAHRLIHWRHRLNDWVLTQLEEDGELRPEAIVARERLKDKARRKQAERIVDDWHERGLVKNAWRDFNAMLRDAGADAEEAGDRWG